jgi:hypothetical protein
VGERLDEAIDKLAAIAAFMTRHAQQGNFQVHADTLAELGGPSETRRASSGAGL